MNCPGGESGESIPSTPGRLFPFESPPSWSLYAFLFFMEADMMLVDDDLIVQSHLKVMIPLKQIC